MPFNANRFAQPRSNTTVSPAVSAHNYLYPRKLPDAMHRILDHSRRQVDVTSEQHYRIPCRIRRQLSVSPTTVSVTSPVAADKMCVAPDLEP